MDPILGVPIGAFFVGQQAARQRRSEYCLGSVVGGREVSRWAWRQGLALSAWLRTQMGLLTRAAGWRLGDWLRWLGLPVSDVLARPVPLSAGDRSEVCALLKMAYDCVVCRLQRDDEARLVFWFLVENYGEAPWIERLHASAGFCPSHFWMLARTGARYPLSYVAQYLAEDWLQRLRQVRKDLRGAKGRQRVLAALRPMEGCPACEAVAQSARRGVQMLVRGLADPEVRACWERSAGLCWPHFQLAVELAEPAVLKELLAVQRRSAEGGPTLPESAYALCACHRG